MKILFLQIIAFLFLISCLPEKREYKITNEKVEVQVFQLENNQLAYLIKNDGQMVIDTSLIGIIGKKNTGFKFEIELIETLKKNSIIRFWGKR